MEYGYNSLNQRTKEKRRLGDGLYQIFLWSYDAAGRMVEQLRQSYSIYRGCSDMARNLLEINLHQIEKTISAAGVDPAKPGAGYQPPGVEPPQNMKTDFRA